MIKRSGIKRVDRNSYYPNASHLKEQEIKKEKEKEKEQESDHKNSSKDQKGAAQRFLKNLDRQNSRVSQQNEAFQP